MVVLTAEIQNKIIQNKNMFFNFFTHIHCSECQVSCPINMKAKFLVSNFRNKVFSFLKVFLFLYSLNFEYYKLQ